MNESVASLPMGETLLKRTTLPDGIRVITEEVPHLRSVTVGFWVGVGSRDEPEELLGVSHFIEHLLFKGTGRRSARDIAEEFDAIGGELNAFSAKEYTCYYAKVLDDDLEKAMDIMADMLKDPLMREKDIEAERRVILEEISMHEDAPDDIVHDYFAAALWDSHPLGRSVLGSESTIRRMGGSDIIPFFQENYCSGNLVVAAAGHVSHEKMIELVDRYLGLPGRDGRPERRSVPPQPNGKKVVVKRDTEQAHIVLGMPGLPRNHPDRFALAILDNILGGGMSSRLFQKIREELSLAYSVYSYHSMYRDTGLMAVYAGTSPSNTKRVVQEIQEELRKLAEEGVSDEELSRAKNHIKGSIVLGLEDSGGRMTRLGKSEIYGGEILSLDRLLERLEGVTVEQVNDLAERLFSQGKTALAVVGPFDEGDLELDVDG
ncbi:MAG: pitrilysin family protein [Candidatus Geothermincolales bacterium]